MKKLLVSIFAMLFCVFNISAQELPKIIPPSPNAASLEKYVELPVSMATGIPNIAVPIYNITEGNISLPISLSYHAGGHKVEEVASWVGLGWSLNAGGVLSRTTVGLPDDAYNGYITNSMSVQALRNLNPTYQTFYNYAVGSINGTYDFEPDIFSYNIGGVSGRFFYDQVSNTFVQTPKTNVKIDYNYDANGEIDRWILTTPDGTKYYMGKSNDGSRTGRERNSSNSSLSYSNNNFSLPASSASIPDHYTSWYVMDVVSPKGDNVKFTYDTQIITQLNKTSEEFLYNTACATNGYSASFSQSTVNQKVLDKIEFTNGYVKFNEDSAFRSDLAGSKALKTIKIYNTSNNLLKEFELNHSYTVSNVETGNWTALGGTNASKRRYRLRLNSVTEKSATGNSKPPYSFTYNTTALPSRFSNAQDYWGYYNGSTSNTDLIPKTKLTYTPAIYTGTAERTVNTGTVQAGVLTKITYPTGGTAEYFYESNTAGTANITTDSGLDYNLRNRLNTVNFDFLKVPANLDSNPFYNYSKTFTISSGVKGNINFATSVTGCDNSQSLANFACDYLIKIIGVSNTSYSHTITDNNFDMELPAGTYKMVAIEQGVNGGSIDFSVNMTWGEDPHPTYLNVGGLRVYKTKLNDANGTVIEKNYNYNLFSQPSSSGYMIASPTHLNMSFHNGSCSPVTNVPKITSYTQMPGAVINGSVVGYSNVTESITNGGKTEYTYSAHGDFPHYSPFGSIHLPDLYINWIRGDLLKKEDYVYKNSSYSKVFSTENEYERISTTGYPNVGFKTLTTISSDANTTFQYGFYSAVSEYYRLKKTTTTVYNDSGNIVTVKNNVYNNNPLLASETTTTDSRGSTLKTKIFYPDDVTSTNSLGADNLTDTEKAVIDRMKNFILHMVAIPVQTESYKNNVLLSRQRTLFTEPKTDFIAPQTIQTSIGSSALEDRITFHSYHSSGNVREVSKKDGTHIVYIWGYNDTQPIAKIENATFADIPTSVYNAIISASNTDANSPSTTNENNLRTELAKLRNTSTCPNLSNAQITTFTYDLLIGVTSTTDPRGRTAYYLYDDYGRLQYVKDHDNKILTKNEYNYKN